MKLMIIGMSLMVSVLITSVVLGLIDPNMVVPGRMVLLFAFLMGAGASALYSGIYMEAKS